MPLAQKTPAARWFGALNALSGALLVAAVFGVLKTRFWLLDVPACAVAGLEWLSAIGLLFGTRWWMRALRVAAYAAFLFGLSVVAMLVLSIAFLFGVHGEAGAVGMEVAALIIALAIPYTIAVPALELVWLKRLATRSA
jgi:hypothetical protein